MSLKTIKPKINGFTLVELSIVLVIIGLIVSSVLVGQSLINQAEIRGTVTEYEQFKAAAATFRVKYNGLPGDIRGNSLYGFGVSGNDGDNDGLLSPAVDGDGDVYNTNADSLLFWTHLGSTGAELIPGAYDGIGSADYPNPDSTLPKASIGNYWFVSYDVYSGRHYYTIGALGSLGVGFTVVAPSFTPSEALSFDTKIDDGMPGRGIAVLGRSSEEYGPYFESGYIEFVKANSAVPIDDGSSCGYGLGASLVDANYNTAVSIKRCLFNIRF